MATLSCPNCGAPAQQAPGQTTLLCTFCGRSFSIDAPAPTPPPGPSPFAGPPPAWGPPQPMVQPIIVLPPGQSFDMPMPMSTVTTPSYAGMRLLFGLLPVAIALIVAGSIAFTTMHATGAAGGLAGFGGWNGTTPLLCGGNDEVTASGINASLGAGPIINAGGNCHVQCTGCTLKASVVITAGGNAQIDLIDSHVEGSQAVVAGGNAEVRLTGASTLVGQVVQGGNASITAPPGAMSTGGSAAPGAAPKATASSPGSAHYNGPDCQMARKLVAEKQQKAAQQYIIQCLAHGGTP